MPSLNLFRRLMTRALRTKATAPIRMVSGAFGRRIEELEDRTTPTSGLTPAQQQLLGAYDQLPMSFVANEGQTASQVQYLSQGNGYTLFLTPTGSVLNLQQPSTSTTSTATTGAALALNLVGSNPLATVEGQGLQSSTTNYLIGNNPSDWHTNVPNYGQVAYQDVYPGINLIYYGNQQQLEYDFDVAPGANPGVIRFDVQGTNSVSLDSHGNLILSTAGGNVTEHAPVIYQTVGDVQQSVAGKFVLLGQNQVGFQVGAYNTSLPLVIDPILGYSTAVDGTTGGQDYDTPFGIAVDSSGDAYITGYSETSNFATSGAFQTSNPGISADGDAYVAKLNATGTALLYCTYLGGSSGAQSNAIAVNAAGDAYVAGRAFDSGFPTTSGAYETSNHGSSGNFDGFVSELNSTGTGLLYSTYLGGTAESIPAALALSASGNVYVTGTTYGNYPTTSGAFETSYPSGENGSGFVTELNSTGSNLLYSTYLGGTNNGTDGDAGLGIAVNSAGNAYVTGSASSHSFPTTSGAYQTTNNAQSGSADAFVTELNTTGTGLVYSTYLGGSISDVAVAIAMDSSGDAYVTGTATSTNFPTTAGAFQTTRVGPADPFVTELNPTGTGLVYSTYLGGSGNSDGSGDYSYSIVVNSSGNAFIAGAADSTNFPTTAGAYQTTKQNPSANEAGFLTELNTTGTGLVFSSYLSGTNNTDNVQAIALDTSGNVYVASNVFSTNFPATSGAYQSSGAEFVTKFNLGSTTSAPSIAASFSPTSIAVNGTSTLTFTITNSNTSTTLNGVAFTDTLPAGLTVTNGSSSVGGGTLTITGGNTITLTGASVSAASSLPVPVTVTGATAGSYTTTTGNVSSTNGGTGNTATSNTLTVVSAPSIAASFSPTSVAVNGTTTLTFTITNSNSGTSLSGVAFTDTLPSGLTVANGSSSVGGGTLTITGGNTITLTGASVSAASSLPVPVTVTGATAGSYTTTTGAVSSTNGGTGGTATSNTLTVVSAPSIAASFSPTSILVAGTTTLTFTITNSNASTTLTGVAFTDTLPTGLTVSNGSSSVGGGTLTITGGNTITLTGASVSAASSLPVPVTVTGANTGNYTTTTGAVSSTNGGTGNTATSNTLSVNPANTYTDDLTSGVLTIGQAAAGNDALTLSLAGGTYTLTDTGGLKFGAPTGTGAGSVSGGGTATITIPSAAVTSIVVTLGSGTNSFTFLGSNGATAAPISVNTGSTAADTIAVTGAVSDSGNISLTSGGTITTSAALSASGAGSILLTASTSITVGANLTGGTGGTTLLANGTGGGNTGVTVNSGATVSATGAGPVSVTGTGGSGGSLLVFGVYVTGAITSGVTGTVTVTGTGGSGGILGDSGVAVSGGTISSGGTGTVTVNGTGGGIGTSEDSDGISLVGGMITSGGGTIQLTGTGGPGSGGSNYGVLVDGSIASPNTTLNVSGNVGASTTLGINLDYSGTAISAGSGNVTLTSTGSINETSPAIITTTGTLTTSSVGGTTLTDSNSVGSFNATNTTSGNISLTNTAAPLTVTGISEVNGGTVTINNTGGVTYANALTGGYTLSSTSTGLTNFTAAVGSPTPLTSVTVNSVTLTAGAIATTGGLTVNDSGAGSITGAITGSGATLLTQGAGTLTLTGTNAYSGATSISAGTLQIGNGGASGSLGTGAVTDNAALVYDLSGSTTVANAISGSGSLTQGGPSASTIILTAANSYGATTITPNTTLQIGNGGTTGSLGTGAVSDGGSLVFDESVNVFVGNAISGPGSLTVSGTDAVILTNTNSYGTTTINGGAILQLGSAGTNGSLGSGAVLDNGALTFVLTGTTTVSNAITGSGELGELGPSGSVVILTGANTYGGLTQINSGTTLQIGNGGASGALGTGPVTDNGSLVFDLSGSTTVSDGISGTGTITQSGPSGSILTLITGSDSASNTTVSSGTLLVNTALASPVSVSSGATLGGTGTTGAVTVNSGGTIDPSTTSTTGTLSTAALTLDSGSTYQAEINAGGSDQIVASGTIALAGTLSLSGTIASTPGQVIQLITNNSGSPIVGAFSNAAQDSTVSVNGINFIISYTGGAGGDNVTLTQPGAWAISTPTSPSGVNITIQEDSSGTQLQELQGGMIIAQQPLAAVTSIIYTDSTSVSNTLTVNYAGGLGGNGFYNQPVTYNGNGTAGEKLTVTGGTFNTITDNYTPPVGGGHTGNLVFDVTGTGTDTNTITYAGLAPVDVGGSTSANFIINLPTGGTSAALSDFGGGILEIANTGGTGFETTLFAAPTNSLTINRGSATDTLTTSDLPDLTVGFTVGAPSAPLGTVTLGGAFSLTNGTAALSVSAGTIGITSGTDSATNGITLDATTAGITESGSGALGTTSTLTTSSVTGTTLGGGNTVSTFNATNTTSGDISLTNTGTLSVTGLSDTAGGTDTIDNAGDVTFPNDLVLGSGLTVSDGSNTTTFTGTVDGGYALQITTTGATQLNSAVGSITPLASVTVTGGTTTLNGQSVVTTGEQNYSNLIITSGPGTLTTTDSNITIGGTTSLAYDLTVSDGTGNTTFTGTVDSQNAPSEGSLTVTSTGTTTFSAAVGSNFVLSSVSVSGGTTAINGGAITTSGTQTYNAVTLGADATLTSTGSGNVSFGSTVDGGFNLTINTAGVTTFGGAVGSTTPLTSVTTDAPGSTDINGGSVTTTGAQSYGDAVTLGADATLTSTGSGNVSFGSTVDGGFNLTINTAGVTAFNGAVGSITPLTSVTTDAPGSTDINGGSVTTTGAQSYGDAVSLSADGALTSTGSGNVSFGSTADGGFNLTVNTAGVTAFNGAVGSITPLISVTTDAPGSTDINGGSVTTTGAQTYGDAVTLGADTTLTSTGSGNVSFGSTVDGGFNLTVNTAGVTAFGGAVGSTTPLTSVTTDAPGSTDINGGSVTTTGAQSYGDAATLGADTTLTSTGSGNVSFGSTVDGGFNLTINTAGVTTFGGAVGSTTPLTSVTTDAPGSTDLNGGSVTTTGAQSYGDAVTLGADTTLTSTGSGNVSFGSTVDGGFNLTINTAGVTTLGGTVGSTTPLTSVTTDAPGSSDINGGSVTTTGAQSYGDAVTLSSDTTLTSTGSGNINFGSTVDGGFNFTINTAGVTTFGGAIGSTTPLTSVTTDAPGSTDINGGSVTTTGAQSYGDAVTLSSDTTLTSTGSGNVSFGSTVDGGFNLTINTAGVTTFGGAVGSTTPLTSVTTDAPGSTDLNGGSVTTTGAQTYNDAVILTSDDTLTSTGSGNITFGSTIDGGFTLTVSTGGSIAFGGAIGSTTPLTSLITNGGGSLTFSGGVTTTGSQSYTSAIGLTGDSTFTSTGNGNITFGSTIDGGFNLTVNTGGVTSFDGPVGSTTPLTSVTTDAPGSTDINGGSVTTTGDQTYNDATILTADDTLTSSGSGNVTFGSTVDGGFALTVNTAGVTTFNGAVGSTTPLTAITTDAPGSTDINGGSITTTGAQSFGDGVTLAADTTLTSTGSGNVTFGSTVDGGFNLTVNTAGVTTFGGAVGSTMPLTSVTTDAPGSTDINGSGVTTTGAQTYNDAVTLGADTTLSSTGSGNVSFESTVDGGFALAVNSAGVTSFDGPVGSTTPLTSVTTDAPGSTDIDGGSVTTTGVQSYGDAVKLGADTTVGSTGSGNVSFGSTVDGGFNLTINTAGVTTFGGAVGSTTPLTSVTTDAPGSTDINGGSVSTTGAQAYGDAVTLGADTTLTSTGSGNVSLGSTVDGGFNFTVNTAGVTTFGGAVGSTTPLTSVTTDAPGSTDLNGGSVTTTGAQTYGDAVALGADTTLTSSGSGNVSFGSTVDGGFNLTVNTAGVTTFGGAVGSTTPLTSVTTDAPGSTTLNGGSVTTTGAQSFGDAVTLGANTTLASTGSGNVTLGATVDGGFNLTINTAGVTTFSGAVGSTTPLTSVTTDAPGSTDISAGSITTTGTQTYSDAVVLGANTTLTSTGSGNVTLGATVNGGSALTVNTAGTTIFSGEVGGITPLTSVTTGASGSTSLNGGAVTTTGVQTYGNAVTLGASTTLDSTGSGNVTLGSTVDGGYALTINTAGVTTLGGAVGGTTPLTSITTDAPGSTSINGKTVTTTGAQDFGDAVTLGVNTTLASTGSGNITLASTVNGLVNGPFSLPFSLTVNTAGVRTFTGAVGGTTPLASLTTSAAGSTSIQGGAVTTTGAQTFGDPVTLLANTTLTSNSSGNITLASTVNGAFSLTVDTAGVTNFGGVVGGTTPLTSVTTDAPGSTTLGAGAVTTSGDQTYGDPVTLGASTTLNSTNGGFVTFASTVNGAFALTVKTGGATTFTGAVGGTTPLASVTTETAPLASVMIDAAGASEINGGSVTTTGDQTFNEPTSVGTNTKFTTTAGGSITFGGTLTGGAGNPTVEFNAGNAGDLTFTGTIAPLLRSLSGASSGALSDQGPLSGFTIDDAFDVVIEAGIYVDGPVLISSAQNVTVIAGGSVGSLTQTTGTGTTTLSGGSLAATGPVNITNTAINLQGGLDASGEPVVLDATSGGVTQGTSVAPLIASDLTLTGAGTFNLNNAANQLPSFNASVNGPVTLQVAGALTLDPKGITTDGNDVNLFIGNGFTVNDNGSSQTAPMINAGTTGTVLIVPGLQATTSLTTFNANIAAKSVQFGNDGTGLTSGSPYTGTAYQNTGDDTFQVRPSPSTTITVVGGLPNTIPGDSILPITTDPAITNVQFVPTPPDAAGGTSISGYYLITYANTTQTKIIFRGIESFENSGLQAAVVQTGPTTYSVRIQQVQGTTVLSNGVTGQGLPFTVTINITSIQNPPTVTFGDVNGDGIPDMIIASGAGSSPLITVVNGVYLTAGSPLGSTPVNLSNLPAAAILGQFSPFSASFGGGLSVAAGDFAGTGKDEVAVAPGPGGGPVVEFWSFASGSPQMTSSFFALDTSFRGGLHLASGTFDGKVDLIVGAGVGGGPRVEVFSGGNGALIDNFFAYNSAYRGGVLVAAGNFDGNGEEIATAAGPGGGPNVKVFEGGNNTLLASIYAFTATSLGNYFQTGVGSLAFGAPIAATTADILANALPQQQELLVSTSPGPQLQMLRLIDSAGTVVPAPGTDLYTSLTSTSGSAILNPTTGQPLQESDLTDGATVAGM